MRFAEVDFLVVCFPSTVNHSDKILCSALDYTCLLTCLCGKEEHLWYCLFHVDTHTPQRSLFCLYVSIG